MYNENFGDPATVSSVMKWSSTWAIEVYFFLVIRIFSVPLGTSGKLDEYLTLTFVKLLPLL